MGFLEAIMLSLALCVDSLVVSATTALRSRIGWRQGLLLAVVFGLCQGLFPLVGALVGSAAKDFIETIDHWVAFGLLAFVGGRMIVESGERKTESGEIEKKNRKKKTGFSMFLLLGVATSIDALAVGIGLGLQYPMSTVGWVVTMIGMVTFAVSLGGVALGRRQVAVPERTSSVVAGVVLIGLGVKILLEHLIS